MPKQIKSDKGGAFISKEYKEFCKTQNSNYIYGTTNVHTGTRLVERTIHSLKNLTLANLEDGQNLRESINRAVHGRRFTKHSEIKKTPFEAQFGRAPRIKLSNLKNAISVDSKDLLVYITWNTAGEINDHLVMSKKKTVEPKFRFGMTFSQTKKPTNTVSTNNFNYPFKLYEKNHKSNSLDSKFKSKIQTVISGTEHTITTDKNKVIHRKLISNPLPFQQTPTAPAKRINIRQNTADQPTCSKLWINQTTTERPASSAEKRHPSAPIRKEAETG